MRSPSTDNRFVNWNTILLAALILAVFLALKRLGLISRRAALQHLQGGAVVVDVRSNREFQSHHLPAAVNVPLDQLHHLAPRQFPDHSRVLLLHCLSGTRSSLARRTLRQMGYSNVYNLGSYGRARRIIASQ
ncbi:MAG: rhodanese-like domain-containing protein [Phycisphaerae bacterium]|nr:rhodanese-like domain-containing protein [Phycisphaerae bacterium]